MYHNGNLNGLCITYSDSIKLKVLNIESFSNGLRHGIQTSFHKNGTPYYLTTYIKNKRVNVVEYDSIGNIVKNGGYSTDTIEINNIVYDPVTLQESKKIITREVREVDDGSWQYYDHLGNLKKILMYSNGVLMDSLIIK